MIQTVLRLGAFGLDTHEQGLLTQQLKMLKGKTQAEWQFVGEQDKAELVISRDANSNSRASVVLGAQQSGNSRRVIEWPLRLFGLIELLTEAEKTVGPGTAQAQPRLLSAQLAALEGPAVFEHSTVQIELQPQLDQVHSSCADFEALVATLAQCSSSIELRTDPLPPDATPHTWSLKRLIWALALREQGRALPAAGTLFKIGSWPSFSEWESSPAYLRLAALYSRQQATLEQGQAFSNLSARDVAAFLEACRLCGLGLTTTMPVQQRAPRPKPEPAPSSLLQRLRSRLGLGYRKG